MLPKISGDLQSNFLENPFPQSDLNNTLLIQSALEALSNAQHASEQISSLINAIENLKESDILVFSKTISTLAWETLRNVHLKPIVNSLEIQELGSNVWNFLNDLNPELQQAQTTLKIKFSQVVLNNLDRLPVQTMIRAARALDDLDFREETLFKKISNHIRQVYRDQELFKTEEPLKANELAYMALAFRKYNFESGFFYELLKKKSLICLDDFKPWHLSLLVKSLGQANKAELTDSFYQKIISKITECAGSFTPLDISYILWGLSYTPVSCQKQNDGARNRTHLSVLIERFTYALINKIDLLPPKEIVRLAWTFRKLNYIDLTLFNEIGSVINTQIEHLTYQEIGTILKILCHVKEIDEGIIFNLIEHITRLINDYPESFNKESLSEIALGIFVKVCSSSNIDEAPYLAFVKLLLDEIFRQSSEDLQRNELSRINSVYVLYILKTKSSEFIPDEFKVKLDEFLIDMSQEPNKSSYLHKDVAHYIKQLKPGFTMEYPWNGFKIDIAFPELKVAVEVDGMNHFNYDKTYMSAHVIKDTILELSGWTIIRISDMQYPGFEARQKRYLENIAPKTNLGTSSNRGFNSVQGAWKANRGSFQNNERYTRTNDMQTRSSDATTKPKLVWSRGSRKASEEPISFGSDSRDVADAKRAFLQELLKK